MKIKYSRLRTKEAIEAYAMILPLLVGLLAFNLWPMIRSFIISFQDYDVVNPAKYAGADNYMRLSRDPLFWQSLKVTTIYSVVSVPLGLLLSLLTALLMNRKMRFIGVFRAIYYLPVVVAGVPVALLWMWIFNPQYGLANVALKSAGLPEQQWLSSPKTALASLIFMSLWGIGGAMLVFLGGLQGVPKHLYEAAELDGCNRFQMFRNVTLPMLSPVILYNLIMGIIGSFQTFTQAFVMTNGGPANSTLFYALYIFKNAFYYLDMGYASAFAWILFAIILVLTLIVLRSSTFWVHYEGERR